MYILLWYLEFKGFGEFSDSTAAVVLVTFLIGQKKNKSTEAAVILCSKDLSYGFIFAPQDSFG